MKLFRAFISFGIALGVLFLAGYITSLLFNFGTEWWTGIQKPVFAPNNRVSQWCQVGVYVMMVIAGTVTILRPHLRKGLWLYGAAIAAGVLWVAAFFVWHLTLFALSLIFIAIVALFALGWFYIKNTRELWLAVIPILAWYIFCFLLNFGVFMLN